MNHPFVDGNKRVGHAALETLLVLNGFELDAVFLAVIIANEVTQRGESTWYEGLQLLAIYVVLGLTFFFV